MIVIILPDIAQEDVLLEQARRGDQAAIMQIYDSYFQPIYQYLRLRVNDSAVAEDLASEVFLKLIEALRGRTPPRYSLRGWLFKVARSEIARHYGKSKRFPTITLEEWLPAPDHHDPERQFMQSLSLAQARRAIQALAPDQQEVLVLRFGQALSLQETADIMNKSVTAIKSLQFRAVNTLRKVLGELQMETSNG